MFDDSKLLTASLPYLEPYRYDLLCGFLQFRAIEGVECVSEDVYQRTVRLDNGAEQAVGWIEVQNIPEQSKLKLQVTPGLESAFEQIVCKTKLLFDTESSPTEIERGLEDFYSRVNPVMHVPGVRLPCSFDGFEMTIRAVLGQQITVKAANTLAGRLAAEFGDPYPTPDELPAEGGLSTLFPKPAAFGAEDAAERLGQLGVIRQRAEAICTIAQMLEEGTLELRSGADPIQNAKTLQSVKGIGPWTAQYVMMRAFAYSDGFPATDYGIKHAFPGLKPREIEKLSEAWKPYRSYAVMSIWSVPPQ